MIQILVPSVLGGEVGLTDNMAGFDRINELTEYGGEKESWSCGGVVIL